MRRFDRLFTLVTVLFIVLSTAPSLTTAALQALAQDAATPVSPTGSLIIRLQGADGSLVPGGTFNIRNADGIVRTFQDTDYLGYVRVPSLDIGDYVVSQPAPVDGYEPIDPAETHITIVAEVEQTVTLYTRETPATPESSPPSALPTPSETISTLAPVATGSPTRDDPSATVVSGTPVLPPAIPAASPAATPLASPQSTPRLPSAASPVPVTPGASPQATPVITPATMRPMVRASLVGPMLAAASNPDLINKFRGVRVGVYDSTSPTSTGGEYDLDGRTSLQPGQKLACGGYVHYWNRLNVSSVGGNGTYTFQQTFDTRTNNNEPIGFDRVGAIFLDTGDSEYLDPGQDATVSYSAVGSFESGGPIVVTYTVSGLDYGDVVMVRTSMHLRCDIPQVGSNVQAALVGANQTVPMSTSTLIEPVVSFNMIKSCPDLSNNPPVGSTIAYDVTIYNTGSVTLTFSNLTDGRLGQFSPAAPSSFQITASSSRSCTFYSTLTPSDAAAGGADNRVDVQAVAGTTSIDRTSYAFCPYTAPTPSRTVTPIQPTVTAGVCSAGAWTAPTVSAPSPDQNGIAYTVSGPDPDTGAYTVTATHPAGTVWGELPGTGWVTSADGVTATYSGFAPLNPCLITNPISPVVQQATCSGGVVTSPTITTITTPGIQYTLSPSGPYDATSLPIVVTVTATLQDGYGWASTLTSPWVLVNATTATRTVALDATTCATVIPARPTIQQAICTGGTLQAPNITLPTTDNISYSVDTTSYAPGSTVVVTATALNGTSFASAPPEWTYPNPADLTVLQWSWTFKVVSCVNAVPVMPNVTQAACSGGQIQLADVQVIQTAGVDYTLSPPPPYADSSQAQTVTITAQLQDGYAWDASFPSDQWTQLSATTAQTTMTLQSASCISTVPISPTIEAALCRDGVVTNPDIRWQKTAGIDYAVDKFGPYVPGDTVVLTANLLPGYSFSSVPGGWQSVTPTQMSFTVTFDNARCQNARLISPTVTQAACRSDKIVPPQIVLSSSTGISYSAFPSGPYDGTQQTQVVVTAVAADGYSLEPAVPSGWQLLLPDTATYSVTLAAASCPTPSPSATSTASATITPPPATVTSTPSQPTATAAATGTLPPSPPPSPTPVPDPTMEVTRTPFPVPTGTAVDGRPPTATRSPGRPPALTPSASVEAPSGSPGAAAPTIGNGQNLGPTPTGSPPVAKVHSLPNTGDQSVPHHRTALVEMILCSVLALASAASLSRSAQQRRRSTK